MIPWQKIKIFFWGAPTEMVLTDLLCQKTDTSSLPEQMLWLQQLLVWLFPGEVAKSRTRFRFFFSALEKNPPWRENFRQTFLNILEKCPFFSLYTHLAVEHGLWSDIAGRVFAKFIPSGQTTEFREIFVHVFDALDEIDQLKNISDEDLQRLGELLRFTELPTAWRPPQRELREALLALAIQVAYHGADLRPPGGAADERGVSHRSFFRLSVAVQSGAGEPLGGFLDACEAEVQRVYGQMEKGGVSVALVNRLETIGAILRQMRQLAALEAAPGNLPLVRDFLAAAIEASIHSRSILGHLRAHLYLLSRKIVERNGQSADHYIARTVREMRGLFWSAAGGGLIVVGMTILKTALIHGAPAPLFLALGISIIYVSGFLAMQFFGFTLATKIPSFTASRLATLLVDLRRRDFALFQREFHTVLKSQIVALLGNLAGVIPFATAIHFLWRRGFGADFLMSPPYAEHILADLNPLRSFVLPLAALTGGLLWLSSVAGGWFENWIVFHRIPEAVRGHYRFRMIFGRRVAERVATMALRHSSAFATNVSLGLLFGFVPLMGGLLGLNWNGHHVTISTAAAVFALATLNFSRGLWSWVAIVSGLILVGVLNFIVSFGLALYIASRAQKMRFWVVLRHLSGRFAKPAANLR